MITLLHPKSRSHLHRFSGNQNGSFIWRMPLRMVLLSMALPLPHIAAFSLKKITFCFPAKISDGTMLWRSAAQYWPASMYGIFQRQNTYWYDFKGHPCRDSNSLQQGFSYFWSNWSCKKISPDPDLCSQKGSNESIYEIMFDNRILNHRNWILKAFSHFSRKNHRIIDYLNLDTVILSFILITSHLFHLSQSIHFSVRAFPISSMA